jgi:hypothetical protein
MSNTAKPCHRFARDDGHTTPFGSVTVLRQSWYPTSSSPGFGAAGKAGAGGVGGLQEAIGPPAPSLIVPRIH